MNKLDVLVNVLDVAMLTNNRSPGEQRAMLDLALELDKERGAFVSTNPNPMPPNLVADVEATYETEGRRVTLTKAQREQYDRLRDRWSWCKGCGYPKGAHGSGDTADGHPRCPDATALGTWNLAPHRVESAA